MGDAVCILMGNVPEWPIADLGTIIAGGVGVGLYPSSSAEQIKYIVNHSNARVLLVDATAQLEKVLSIQSELPKIEFILSVQPLLLGSSNEVNKYSSFLQLGRDSIDRTRETIIDRGSTAQPDDTAIMVYTSGTTGNPKGACLSHRYIINSVESLRKTIPIYETDTCFSYLPYCHVAERISGLYNRLYAGTPAWFVDDLAKLSQYMLEVRPTVFASLPRFFEKVHARVMADVAGKSQRDREAFLAALETGRRLVRLQQSKSPVPLPLQREYQEIALPVLNLVKQYFGGTLRLATSGGAPLPAEVAEFFAAAGIPILQAYGLTENICVAFNRAEDYKFGTVGRPMPGCEVRIAEDGEILVRSEMMFSGYYKEPDKTTDILQEGWLLTGDLGQIDAHGYLSITGRKKELIVTSTGKNISPALLENMIKEHHLISQAMVYGDGKSYLVALITINQPEAEAFAKSNQIPFEDFSVLLKRPALAREVELSIQRMNSRVSSSEAVRKFKILDRDFLIEADEVTPTMKLKRDVIIRNYGRDIEELYSGIEISDRA
jgi:long-chain acyl-CoA synthetase